VFVTIQAASDEAIPARIAEVGTEASPTTRTYPVKLRFQPPAHMNIRPGMTGFARGRGDVQHVVATGAGPSGKATAADGASENVSQPDGELDQVAHREVAHDAAPHVIPAVAVFDRDGERQVWIYDSASKVVHARRVKVLETTPYGLKVSGLQVGEWVITAGVHYLEENQTVRLMSDDRTQPGSAI
jgi:multidrug efflux pump subunit AcrA (membrane-fusion protein)